ncbi:MAG: PhzF family phenazine biosynthesis protein [Oscillospiraceae bacterium]|nr:PhzF family phenazine biosynthesis protein [Oscillospiraceae bacterium]
MKFYIVDVFAEQKYQGNQLAVFIPDCDMTTEEMQQISREINFSETTFIMGKKQNGSYDVRYFTPDVEIPFAGHPTLGTAFVIWKILENCACDKIVLNLPVGEIPVTIDGDILTMTQNTPEFGLTIKDSEAIANILSIKAGDLDDVPIQIVSTGLPCLIVPLKTYDALSRCKVNHEAFGHFIDHVFKCNLLAFHIEDEANVRVRVFVDDTGFLEDAATGSANGNLAGYLLKYNMFGTDNIQYTALQGVEMNRPSRLLIHAQVKDDNYTIEVGGKVCPIAEGVWS